MTLRPGAEPDWAPAARGLVRTLDATLGDRVLAVYAHGSAVLGGWTTRSDLDALVVLRKEAVLGAALLSSLGRRLLDDATVPVEVSMVDEVAAARPRHPWPFVAHVAGRGREGRIVLGESCPGDADLVLHYWVAREVGLALRGPDACHVVGPPSRAEIVNALADDLAWAVEHADSRYAVLNACRARAFVDEGLVLSKMAGARWYLHEQGGSVDESLVKSALRAQRAGRDMGPADDRVRAAVVRIRGAGR